MSDTNSPTRESLETEWMRQTEWNDFTNWLINVKLAAPAPAATGAFNEELERKKFEEWAKAHGWRTDRPSADPYRPDEYASSGVQGNWLGWQARARAVSAPEETLQYWKCLAQEREEVIAKLRRLPGALEVIYGVETEDSAPDEKVHISYGDVRKCIAGDHSECSDDYEFGRPVAAPEERGTPPQSPIGKSQTPITVREGEAEGTWIAHSLEFDLIGCDPDRTKAIEQLKVCLGAQIAFGRKRGITNCYFPAPIEYWIPPYEFLPMPTEEEIAAFKFEESNEPLAIPSPKEEARVGLLYSDRQDGTRHCVKFGTEKGTSKP